MNRVRIPRATHARLDDARQDLLNHEELFDVDHKDLYIKHQNKLVPIGGACKQNALEAGDNIEIIRDGTGKYHLDGERGSIWISETVDNKITVRYVTNTQLTSCYLSIADIKEQVLVSRLPMPLVYQTKDYEDPVNKLRFEYENTVSRDYFLNYRQLYICLAVKGVDELEESIVPQGVKTNVSTWKLFTYGSETVRLVDNVDVDTVTLSPDGDNTYKWKGTIKIGELKDHNAILLLTKLTEIDDEIKGILGGEILVKLTKENDDLAYGHYAITVSSTGSWSLKGAIEAASEVRMCKCKWKGEYYYGLKMPGVITSTLETSVEKHVIDNLYEEEEKYTDTETSEVRTEYDDDFFMGMAVTTTYNETVYRYDDRSYIALCNNETGTAVVLNDTGIVPQGEDSRVHWQYCAIKDLMNLRGEELKDDGTGLYEYYTNNYYLYFKTFFQNEGGNSRDSNDKVALTDCYVCNKSGNFDPELTPANVVEHVDGDRSWLNIDESIKQLNITKNSNPKTFEIYIYRSAMNTFYIRAGSNYIRLNYSGLYSGYNGWYWVSLDNIFNNLGFTAQGVLKNYVGKGYYLYLYMYRRTSGTNYSFRVTQVAITTQQMNTAPSNGTTGVVKNYGVVDQDWVDFNGDLIRNDTYYNLTLQQHVPLMTFVDLVETIEAIDLNNSNNFVHSFGNFKFITTAIKEHEVEKTRIVPKISQDFTYTDVNYSSFWEDVYLHRVDATNFTLTKNGNSLNLTQAFQSQGFNYWYYAKLDDVINLAGYQTGLEDDNLEPWYGKGYYLYLRIYRRTDSNYDTRITHVSITNAIVKSEPSETSNLILAMEQSDQDWIDLNAVIVTTRSNYYYTLNYGSEVIAFSITQKGKKYNITESKPKAAEVWMNGWYDIPDPPLLPHDYVDPEIEYLVLSDKSNDNDYYAETRYFGTVAEYKDTKSGLPSMQDTGEDNAPYKIIITQKVLSMQDLKDIADYVRHLERQVALDLSECTVANNAKVWDSSIFEGCVSLREMRIPQGVEEFGQGIFKWCTYLRKLDLTPSADTLHTIGGTAWEQNAGFLVSTRVTTLLIPKNVSLLRNYLIYSSNIKRLIFLHDHNTGLKEDQSNASAANRRGTLSCAEWAWVGQTGYGSLVYNLPEGFQIFVSKDFWENGRSLGNNAGQPNKNGSGWDWYPNDADRTRWNKRVIDSIIPYPQDGDQKEWQAFAEQYNWTEDMVNEVRRSFGYEDAIEIKETNITL